MKYKINSKNNPIIIFNNFNNDLINAKGNKIKQTQKSINDYITTHKFTSDELFLLMETITKNMDPKSNVICNYILNNTPSISVDDRLNYLLSKYNSGDINTPLKDCIYNESLFNDKKYVLHIIDLFYKNNDVQIFNYLINIGFPLIYKLACKHEPIKTLNLNIENFLSNFDSISIDLFSKYNMVITGSFVLQFITGVDFRPNDLDIFMSEDDFNNLVADQNETYKVNIQLKNNTNAETFKNSYSKNILSQNKIKLVCSLNVFNKTPLNEKLSINDYQLIIVNDPTTFIEYDFDFDMCAIMFDFKTSSFITNSIRDRQEPLFEMKRATSVEDFKPIGFKSVISEHAGFVNTDKKPDGNGVFKASTISPKFNFNFNEDYSIMTFQKSYIENIMRKKNDSYYFNYMVRKIKRMIKYIDRGFYIENWKEMLLLFKNKMFPEGQDQKEHQQDQQALLYIQELLEKLPQKETIIQNERKELITEANISPEIEKELNEILREEILLQDHIYILKEKTRTTDEQHKLEEFIQIEQKTIKNRKNIIEKLNISDEIKQLLNHNLDKEKRLYKDKHSLLEEQEQLNIKLELSQH